MLKATEHESKLNEIMQMLKVEGVDQAKASEIVQALRDNYTEVETTFTTTNEKITKFTTDNEGLRAANMNLLVRLGNQVTETGKPAEPKPADPKPADKVLSLDDIVTQMK